MIWKQHMNEGVTALMHKEYVTAELRFRDALEFARDDFKHTDPKIAETFAWLGRSLLVQDKIEEARPALRQATLISKALKKSSNAIATADYFYACMEPATDDAKERRERALAVLNKFLSQEQVREISKEADKLLSESSASKLEILEPEAEAQLDKNLSREATAGNDSGAIAPSCAQAVPESPSFIVNMKEEKLQPERYALWAEKLRTAIQRASSPQLSEVISGYADLISLMAETVSLYEPPHVAVADHLMSIVETANVLGLYERAGELAGLAIKNYQGTVGPEHSKTAYANLTLAYILADQEMYPEAQYHFRLAADVLRSQSDLDQVWFAKVVKQFDFLQQRENGEKQLFELLGKMDNLAGQKKWEEADKLACLASDKLAKYFPPDHYHFVLLYRRHSTILAANGRSAASNALAHVASYLERKLSDKHEYNKLMQKNFPEFDPEVLNAIERSKSQEMKQTEQ